MNEDDPLIDGLAMTNAECYDLSIFMLVYQRVYPQNVDRKQSNIMV